MATGETGFDDVSFDLISVQYHSLKAGHDYGQYVRDARNAGENEIAEFFEQVMAEDLARETRSRTSRQASGVHRGSVGQRLTKVTMTISSDDVRRLLGASEPDAVLVLIEGRPEVISAAAVDSDEFRGALTTATREQLIERVGSAELSAHELTEQAASLDAMISNLGG